MMATPAPTAGGEGETGGWADAVRVALPVMVGYLPIAMAFGFLMVKAGADPVVGPLMSLFVYAGSSQFLAIAMLANGLAVTEIAIATFLLNLRHAFYGLPLIGRLPRGVVARLFTIFALSDESFALLMARPAGLGGRGMVRILFLNYATWFVGTVIGTIIGDVVPASLEGLTFCLTALFVVLLVEQARAVRDWLPFAVAIAAMVVAAAIAPGTFLLIAIGVAALVLGAVGALGPQRLSKVRGGPG